MAYNVNLATTRPQPRTRKFIRLRAPQLCLRKLRRHSSRADRPTVSPVAHAGAGARVPDALARERARLAPSLVCPCTHYGARPLPSRARLTVLGVQELFAVGGVVGLSNVPRAREG